MFERAKKTISIMMALAVLALCVFQTPLLVRAQDSTADNLVGEWERFGDNAEGSIINIEKVGDSYQATLEKVTGTLIDLGFAVGDLKMENVIWSSDTSYTGKDLFRYEGGGYEYRDSALKINSQGILEVTVYSSDDTNVIIGTNQTWRRIAEAPVVTVPDSGNPTILKGQVKAGQAYLAWSAVDGAKGYNLYRGSYSGGESTTPITDFPITDTNYTDPNVNNGQIYYYICKAILADNTEVPASNEVVIDLSRQIILQIENKYMTVNGVQKEIDPGKGTAPIILNGRTILPIRAIAEELGGTVGWDGNQSKVTINLNSKTLELWIGRNTTLVNGSEVQTDVAPQIINSRTMIPLRYVVENLGYDVAWNGDTKTVTITY